MQTNEDRYTITTKEIVRHLCNTWIENPGTVTPSELYTQETWDKFLEGDAQTVEHFIINYPGECLPWYHNWIPKDIYVLHDSWYRGRLPFTHWEVWPSETVKTN